MALGRLVLGGTGARRRQARGLGWTRGARQGRRRAAGAPGARQGHARPGRAAGPVGYALGALCLF